MTCDHCNKNSDSWPTGLMSYDREQGTSTSDYRTCPDCVIPVHFTGHLAVEGGSSTISMLREGVKFDIHWYWFDAPTGTMTRYFDKS